MPSLPRPQPRRRGTTRREALQAGSLSLLGLSLSATHFSAAPNTGPKLYFEAYTDRSSYQPGDEVRIHVSTNASRYALEFARLGVSREVVWCKEDLPGVELVPGMPAEVMIKTGKTICFAQSLIKADDIVIARASGTFRVVPKKG